MECSNLISDAGDAGGPNGRHFVPQEEAERLRLRSTQEGFDRVFMPSKMSDGTLRSVRPATLLLPPYRPRPIVLDEPELGLHPFTIAQLGALHRQAVVG